MTKLGMFRGIAILAVLVNHAATHGMMALTWWGNQYGKKGQPLDLSWLDSPSYWSLMAFKHLAQFSVPLFLFCSGFYFAYSLTGSSATGLWPVVRGSLKSLIGPFIIWTVASVALYLLEIRLSPTGRTLDLAGFLEQRMKDYNFVVVLAELLLLLPVLAMLGVRRPAVLLAVMATIQAANSALLYARYVVSMDDGVVAGTLRLLDRWDWALFPRLGFYFFVGFYIAQYHDSVRNHLRRLRWILAVTVFIFGCSSIFEAHGLQYLDGNYWDDDLWKISTFLYATTLLLALVAWDWHRGSVARWLDRIGIQSYGIYLVHPIVTVYVDSVLSHAFGQYAWARVSFPVVLLAAALGGPWLVMWTVSRSPARRYYRILFGSSAGSLTRRAPPRTLTDTYRPNPPAASSSTATNIPAA